MPDKVSIESVRMIFNDGNHNAFTDLCLGHIAQRPRRQRTGPCRIRRRRRLIEHRQDPLLGPVGVDRPGAVGDLPRTAAPWMNERHALATTVPRPGTRDGASFR